MPRVAVILCAFNAETYLSAAVESILAQTFADFELIAVDDGSTDSTPAVLDAFAARDPRVRVMHQANTGQVRAAINGIAASAAPLVARMDADDVARPDRLAKQVAFFDAHPQVVLVGGAYELTDGRGRLLTTIRQPAGDAALQAICLTGRCPICQPLAMFRRDAYDRVGGYRAEFTTAEDLDLWLRLGEIGEMACLPDVLLQYRQHDKSISESKQQTMIGHQREICRQAWQRRGLAGYAFDGDAVARHRRRRLGPEADAQVRLVGVQQRRVRDRPQLRLAGGAAAAGVARGVEIARLRTAQTRPGKVEIGHVVRPQPARSHVHRDDRRRARPGRARAPQ